MDLTIRGIQQAQAANNKIIAAVKPSGALGRAIQYGTTRVHRYAVGVSHVDTGAMRASHRMQLSTMEGRVYLDRSSRNPRSRQMVYVYGFWEHMRGGGHAFYERTVREAGPQILRDMAGMVQRGLP